MTKKFVSMLLALVMCLSLSAPVLAVEEEPAANSTSDSVLTFEEYLEKYGEENVKAGFAAAEAEAMGGEQALSAQNADDSQNEGKSLFECLSEGEFLGLKVLGVTDIAPGEPGFMVCVEKAPGLSGAPEAEIAPEAEVALASDTPRPDSQTQIKMPGGKSYNTIVTDNYEVYYSAIYPDYDAREGAYESLAGAFFKKYSNPGGGCYQCNTTVTFDNTKLVCDSQNLNLYLYLNVHSNASGIDFGLMGNAASANKGQGLYAFYNISYVDGMTIEAFPKVMATTYGNRAMTLENKTVTIKLSADRSADTVTMYMESNGSMLFYKQEDLSNIGSGDTLTFLQTMSYVCSTDKEKTQLYNGGYVTDVKFSDTVLFKNGTGKPTDFLTVSPNTYFTMVCEPTYITYVADETKNTQTVSIYYKKGPVG